MQLPEHDALRADVAATPHVVGIGLDARGPIAGDVDAEAAHRPAEREGTAVNGGSGRLYSKLTLNGGTNTLMSMVVGAPTFDKKLDVQTGLSQQQRSGGTKVCGALQFAGSTGA